MCSGEAHRLEALAHMPIDSISLKADLAAASFCGLMRLNRECTGGPMVGM